MFLNCLKVLLLIFLFGVSCFSLILNVLSVFSFFNQIAFDSLLLTIILNLICNIAILLSIMIHILFNPTGIFF